MSRSQQLELGQIADAIREVINQSEDHFNGVDALLDSESDYLGILSLFDLIKHGSISEEHISGCANAVYGWMPCMLRNGVDIDEAKRVIESGLNDQTTPFVNRSWVGTSKFLYFLDDKKYAIWDSRVKRAIFNGGCDFDIKNSKDYQLYCKAVLQVCDDISVKKRIVHRFNSDISKKSYLSGTRLVEVALYLIGEPPKKLIKQKP